MRSPRIGDLMAAIEKRAGVPWNRVSEGEMHA